MQKSIILLIFITLCLVSSAQDLTPSGVLYASGETHIAEVKLQADLSDDSLATERIYNLTDNDWNSYGVVKIGNQYWMAENLKTTKFNDGTTIPVISDYNEWSSLVSPGYCLYNNDSGKYKSKYGLLYNGYTVSTGKLCPIGWHVPSEEEWAVLINYCGKKIAGGNLKERYNWMSPNTGATNATGFTALPGGSRGNLGSFMDAGIRGHWWSSTENNNTDVWNGTMSYSGSTVNGGSDHKKSGLSVRCMKDN